MKIDYAPIGIIRSSFKETRGMPIQPAAAAGVQGMVEMFEEYRAGLKDLDGFSHIILLYHFHRSRGFNLALVPFLDAGSCGLFATRAPKRPNAIGLSVVQPDKIEGGIVHIQNVDILDGTPCGASRPTFRNSTRPWTYESVGSRTPSRASHAGNRMHDSRKTANTPFRAT
jgi:tRNA-Thr(GGU) m(6)t(6)A37 methyltransferase TsaA